MKVRIPSRPLDITAFLLLAFLCYQAHQLARHLVGAALCGGFGSMTFTVTTTRQPCSFPMLVTLSGPVLTYGLAWFGMFLLRSPKYKLFAYALIFASFAHLRFIQTLTGRGDELILAEQWFGVSSGVIVAAIVFLISLPPVIAAFRVIANRQRLLVFIGSWLLPLPLLFLLLFGNEMLFGADGIGTRGSSFLGISLIVLITDLVASVLLIRLAPPYLRPQEDAYLHLSINGDHKMNEETFNLSIRKFLKIVGIGSQREIERAVIRAMDEGRITGNESIPATVTLEIAGLNLNVKFDGEIRLE